MKKHTNKQRFKKIRKYAGKNDGMMTRMVFTAYVVPLQCPLRCGVATIQRSVSCSRVDEAGNWTVIADVFCRYLDKPVSKAKCNEDDPCGRESPTV